MNYIYYNEFGKEIKKYLSPIAKGSSGIKIYIFSDFDNSSETEYEVSASFKKSRWFCCWRYIFTIKFQYKKLILIINKKCIIGS